MKISKFFQITILLPVNNPWEPLLNSLNKFSDDFMEVREQPEQQKREDIFS